MKKILLICTLFGISCTHTGNYIQTAETLMTSVRTIEVTSYGLAYSSAMLSMAGRNGETKGKWVDAAITLADVGGRLTAYQFDQAKDREAIRMSVQLYYENGPVSAPDRQAILTLLPTWVERAIVSDVDRLFLQAATVSMSEGIVDALKEVAKSQ